MVVTVITEDTEKHNPFTAGVKAYSLCTRSEFPGLSLMHVILYNKIKHVRVVTVPVQEF